MDMTVVNRSAITVTHKKPFIDWNNKVFPDLPMAENRIGESLVTLLISCIVTPRAY